MTPPASTVDAQTVCVSELTEEQRRDLKVCPRCGSFGDAACFDLRYKPQPHLTPVPTLLKHKGRTL